MHSSSGIPQNLFLCLNSNPRLDDERFSIECRISKTKARRTTNQNQRNYRKEEPMSARGKNKQTARRAGKRVTKLRLVLVLHLIGWENGASELDQSQSDRSRLLCKFINKRFLNTMKENAEERITIDEMVLSGNYVRRWAYPIFERRPWIFR